MRHSDHFPVIVTFENIPLRKPIKPKAAETIWNLNKQGGWDAFKVSTQGNEEFESVFNQMKSNTDNMDKLDKILTKKKFACFGKVKVRNKAENNDLQ